MLNECRPYAIPCLIPLLLMANACSGGGTQELIPTAPPTLTLTYIEDSNPSPIAGDVGLSLDSSASTNQQLVLNLSLQGPISNLFGIAFHIQYNAALITFVQALEGNVLNQDGTPTQFLVSQGSNEIVVGLSRIGNPQAIGGVQVTGNEILFTVLFQPRAAGSTTLTYIQDEMQDIDGTDVTNHPWRAGTIGVN